MTTFRSGTAWNGVVWPEPAPAGDTTTWIYDTASGLVTAKTYADGQGPTYTYTMDGKLATRTWARTDANDNPLVTTYSYDTATGELIGVDYSDATPDIAYTYTRTSQPLTVTDVVGTRTFAYNAQLQEVSETIVGLYNKTLTRSYTTTGMKGRKLGLAVGGVSNYSYSYDMYGRLNKITTPSGDFEYTRLASSDLVSQMTRPNGVTTIWTYEQNRDLITQVQNGAISTYGYVNDAIGRRTSMSRAGSAHPTPDTITYSYNDRSEVTGALSDNVPSYTYAYAYDPIGNRVSANKVGDVFNYTNNVLNQYTAINTDNILYDTDGNVLIRDGWTQIWDGENRLIETSKGDMKLTFAYDYLGRRIEKRVYQEKILQDHLQFLYDDFKQVEELNDVPEIYKSYCWQPEDVGLDFPLIMNTIEGSFYYHTDANKNIVELTDNSANISAHYEYNIFGQSTMVYGSHSENNLFRFSSEYYDRETELLYYNFRYYFPSFGRWISYDPIGENGGKNLYIFLDNNPVDFIDHKGLWSVNFAIDKRFSVGLRGYVSISSKVNLGGGNGSFSVGVTGGVRFYLSEVILNPPMGTILGVFLEKKDVHQEGRVGIGGNVSIVCQCPRGTSSVNCSVDKAIARLQLQARLGYQSKQFRVIGVAEAGGKWDMLTGDLSLYGSLNVKAQRKTLGVWVGFEAGTSGEIPLPFSMPFRIAQINFSIGLPKKCECMDRNIDGSESLLGIF